MHVSNQLAGARTGVCAERDVGGCRKIACAFSRPATVEQRRVDWILPARNLVFLGSGFMGFMVRQL